MKTSPFSTFTSLAVFHLQKENIQSYKSASVLRLNNYVFSLWRDILNNYPPFYKNMQVGLNPCLKKDDKQWVYLLNSRNVESVQKMESNDLLEFMVKQFSTPTKTLSFNNLVRILLETVEAEQEAIESFLLELIGFGFLEWRWPFSGLDHEWDRKLAEILKTYKKDRLLLNFQEVLERIQVIKKSYPLANSRKRKTLLTEAHRMCKRLSESLLSKTQITENQQAVNFESLQHFKADRFELSPERLFYEDTTIAFQPFWDETDVQPIIKTLDHFLNSLDPLFRNLSKSKVLQFFLDHFGSESRVDLFTFYEAFYQLKPTDDVKLKASMIEQQLSWQKALFDNFEVQENGIIKIDLAFLKKLGQQTPKETKTAKANFLGTLIHLFSDGDHLKGFSESSFMGYGKMMGRFLHLFPAKITESLQSWNTKLRGELLWIENTDASLYNPNLHPPLIPNEIHMPGSQNTLPAEHQISISELEIRYDQALKTLNLIHKPSGKRAYIFDLGFEAPESRSPMYQLLLAFSPKTGSQKILSNIINHYFLKQNEAGIILLPRIEIGEQLIIQRKKWLVPKAELPFKPQAEEESDYFLRLNTWREEKGIDSKVFIRLEEDRQKGRGGRKDDYKPQYIDFQSPLFVQLFHKSIKKVADRLSIEEVLPFPSENIANQYFASEYLVHWGRED